MIFLLFLISTVLSFHASGQPTENEAAQLSKKLIDTNLIADLATIYKDSSVYPFNSQEVISNDCPSVGALLIPLVNFGLHALNARKNGNTSISFIDYTYFDHNYPSRGPMDRPRLILLVSVL